MKRAAAVVLAALTLVAVSGCVTRPSRVTSYYTLDYLHDSEHTELRQDTPFSASVHVLDTRIARAYSRPQIVLRGIGPSFVYLPDHLWGIDLSETVANLVQRRIRAHRMFEQTTREFTREEFDYELRSSIGSIEYVVFGGTRLATLEIELSLIRMSDETEVVRHQVRSESAIQADDVSVFVAEANRLLLAEIDAFLSKTLAYLTTGDLIRDDYDPDVPDDIEMPVAEGRTEGVGELLLPSLGPSQNQPFYTIRSLDRDDERSALFGVPIALPAGRYAVNLGSGPADLQMSLDNVEIVSRRRTVVEPSWSALTVDIVDTTRRPVRLRYDIYDAETGESYGGLLSSSETIVAARRVWILAPGRYKIVLNSRPFGTLEDFVTVTLAAGRSEELTVVVGLDEAGAATALRGAGNIDADDSGDPDAALSLSSAVNASFSLALDDQQGRRELSTLLVLDSEVETELTYEIFPLRYEMRNLLAVGLSAADGAPLRVTSDRFRLRNTLIYELTAVYGLYTRLDADTTLIGERLLFDDPTSYVKRHGEAEVERETDADMIRLSPPLMPLTLREGAGLSVQALRMPRFDLGLRGGLGATQTVRLQTYEPAGEEVLEGTVYSVYERGASVTDIGLEFSAFATVTPPWNTTITSTAEVFVPFREAGVVSFVWENAINVVLANNVSLLYRFSLEDAPEAEDRLVIQEHGLFLRLNYLFR